MPRISLEGLAVGVLDDGVVEFAAADEVEGVALVQGLIGSVVTGGPTKQILIFG